MKNESYLRYLLSDNLSLLRYYRLQKAVDLEDVIRSVLLKVRDRLYFVPDHYYRLGTEYSFHGIKKMSELFTIGLPRLAKEYLEIHNGKVYVKGDRMNDWQLLLPHIPPLLLIVTQIWEEYGRNVEFITDFAHDYLLPSIQFTAIPSAYLPEMESFRQENHGFNDLHIHLNGAIETDLAWHDFLRYPEIVYDEIRKAYQNNKVKEQFEQLTDIRDPIEFLDLFSIAGRIREWLFNEMVGNKHIFETESFEGLLTELLRMKTFYKEHPFKHILGENASPLILEGVFYVKILDYLAAYPQNNTVAGLFHYYLLILGICNRLLVQQTDTFGFEQFQKYTSNHLREFSEKTYRQRFLQLAGNDLKSISHLEGRFSPKCSVEENIDIINRITHGFEFLNRCQERRETHSSTISLVAHFIKKSDKWNEYIRFKRFRADLKQRTDALIALINTNGRYAKIVTGIDAAASEFDTPPEVFAPSFRRLRQCGMKHFTFHAGEDFFHVLSGLRAIYEAIYFLGLGAGDRIGHATAAGVEVNLWRENIGEKLWMRVENYMDDLVFAYFLITFYKEKSLEHLLPIIALKVEDYASRIYPSTYSVYELIEAWKMRQQDPTLLDKSTEKMSRIEQIYQYYHSKEGQEKGKAIISIDTYDIFIEQELVCLQHLLLKVMHQKQIVIETLPTSNVIIGQHHSFNTYHLYNWYKWSKDGIKIPTIVVGTDDTGIFATNIYNEYCHIYCMLVFDKGLSSCEAVEYIERLAHNARVYTFE